VTMGGLVWDVLFELLVGLAWGCWRPFGDE